LKVDEDEYDERGIPQHEFGTHVINDEYKFDMIAQSFLLKKRYRDPQAVKLKIIDARAINGSTKNQRRIPSMFT